jgi:2-methylisocitrate lyase-like PEP mutase family enzyme
MTEVAKTASMVASAVEVPIIADADDGYGNALSTMRTVQEFVKTGVAGVHLEDQRFPSAVATSRARRWYPEKRPSASTRRPSPSATDWIRNS